MKSGLVECAKCGGAVNYDGICSVCGQNNNAAKNIKGNNDDDTGNLPITAPDLSAVGNMLGRKDLLATSRSAYLWNRATNEKFFLTQSVSKIGRDQTNNISLIEDHYVSRHHVWVLHMQGKYYVEDLGSTNGTLLNGETLTERRQIFSGDRLCVGKTELVFAFE